MSHIIESLQYCSKDYCKECIYAGIPDCHRNLMIDAAVNLENQEKDIYDLKKRVNKPGTQKSQEWISTKDGIPAKDIKVLSYDKYGSIGTYYFDKDYSEEKSIITHWMFLLEPPKKVKTYKDVFLEAFPDGNLEDVQSRLCINIFFPLYDRPGRCVDCEDCWNQPYPEEEGGDK